MDEMQGLQLQIVVVFQGVVIVVFVQILVEEIKGGFVMMVVGGMGVESWFDYKFNKVGIEVVQFMVIGMYGNMNNVNVVGDGGVVQDFGEVFE